MWIDHANGRVGRRACGTREGGETLTTCNGSAKRGNASDCSRDCVADSVIGVLGELTPVVGVRRSLSVNGSFARRSRL